MCTSYAGPHNIGSLDSQLLIAKPISNTKLNQQRARSLIEHPLTACYYPVCGGILNSISMVTTHINNLTIDGPRGTIPYTLHGDVDFGDNAAIWQYIVHHIRTMNDLQIFLSDNFNYTNLKDFYRQRGGSVPKSLSNSGQINVIRRIAEAFAAHADTNITGRAVVPLAATDENGCCQELLEIIELPTIKAGEVLSQFERTKHHLKAVENNYQVPATIRYMATMVCQLIEYMEDNEGSCHPTRSYTTIYERLVKCNSISLELKTRCSLQ